MSDLIERIPEGFTPGPWRVRENRRHAPDECDLSVCGDIFVLADIGGPNYAHCDPNASLIALAPEIAAEVRRLTAENAELEAERDRFREIVNDFKCLARLPGSGAADKAKSRTRREVAFATLLTERDALREVLAEARGALEQLRIDAGDAGMDDTVEFITAALARIDTGEK